VFTYAAVDAPENVNGGIGKKHNCGKRSAFRNRKTVNGVKGYYLVGGVLVLRRALK